MAGDEISRFRLFVASLHRDRLLVLIKTDVDRARIAHGWSPLRGEWFDHCAALALHQANPRNTTEVSLLEQKSY